MPNITSCRVASPSCCSAPGAEPVRAVSRPLDRDVDLNDIARGDGYLFVRDGVGVAGRGVAARVAIDDVPAFLAAIDHDDRAGGAHPTGTRCRAVQARRAVRADRAGDGRGQGRRRSPLGDDHRRRRARARHARTAPTARPELHDRAADAGRALPRRRHCGTRCRAQRAVDQGRHRPRDPRQQRRADRHPRRAGASAGVVRLELSLLDRRVRRGDARAVGVGRVATPCGRTRSPAPRRAPATPTPISGPPPNCWPARRTRSSTAS